jgi:allantoinase
MADGGLILILKEGFMAAKHLSWPNNKRIAVSVMVMFETFADNAAPLYTVQHSPPKAGTVDHASRAWSTYGGRVGVFRLLDLLDRCGIRATFFTSARCTEEFPDAVRDVVRSGHDIGAHAYTQDQKLATMTADQQRALIRQSIDQLTSFTGRRVTGWASPSVAFTPDTVNLLAEAGLEWHTDVTYLDLPYRTVTPHGVIACVPTTDFSDLRVLRANSQDLFDVYRGTFDYLYRREEISLVTLLVHSHFGGRPLIAAMLEQIFDYFARFPEVWFATHAELGRWALESEIDEALLRTRFRRNAGGTSGTPA